MKFVSNVLQMDIVSMTATNGVYKHLDEGTHHSCKTARTFVEETWSKATGIITFIIILLAMGSASIVLCHKQYMLKTEIAEMRTEIELLKGDINNILMKESSDDDESEEENDYLNYEADDMFEEELEEGLIPSAHARLRRESNLAVPTEVPNKRRRKNGNAGKRGGKTKKGRKNKRNAGNAAEAVHIVPESYDEYRKDMLSAQGEFTFLGCILYPSA